MSIDRGQPAGQLHRTARSGCWTLHIISVSERFRYGLAALGIPRYLVAAARQHPGERFGDHVGVLRPRICLFPLGSEYRGRDPGTLVDGTPPGLRHPRVVCRVTELEADRLSRQSVSSDYLTALTERLIRRPPDEIRDGA